MEAPVIVTRMLLVGRVVRVDSITMTQLARKGHVCIPAATGVPRAWDASKSTTPGIPSVALDVVIACEVEWLLFSSIKYQLNIKQREGVNNGEWRGSKHCVCDFQFRIV